MVPVREWNAGKCSTATGRGNTGHHLEGYLVLSQCFYFFAASTENKRIAAFQSDDVGRSLRELNQQVIDRFLLQRVVIQLL